MVNNQPLDPKAQLLTKAIGMQESGGNINYTASGDNGSSFGAYQWNNQPNGKSVPLAQGELPSNWKINAKAILGDANAPMTPENQNQVAYTQVKQMLDSGLTPAQVASKWNSGNPNAYKTSSSGTTQIGGKPVNYDVANYVTKVQGYAQQLWNQQNQPSTSQPSQQTPQGDGVMFPSSSTDSGLTGGLKAIGNTPQSAVNFGIGVAKSLNPLQTASTIGQIGSGFQDLANTEGTGKAIWDIIKGLPEATYHALVPQGIQSLLGGDVAGASKAFTNDPFGQAAPVVLAAEGGAKLADRYAGGGTAAVEQGNANFAKTGLNVMPQEGVYSKAFGDTVSGIGKPVANAIGGIASIPLKVVAPVISLMTSLSPDTIKAVVSDPASFSKLQQEATSRTSVAENFGQSLDAMIQQKSETGSGYQAFRADTTPVVIPSDFISKTFEDNGLKIKGGKIIADTNSTTRNTADINALQNFYDNWGQKKSMTPNEYLNMRSDIGQLSKFDSAKSGASATIGKQLYAAANETIRPKIQGLKELDAKMSPQIEQFKQAKKDFLNADGSFKDGAINKIANAKGLGKEKLLARMETISPGITKSIQILKAVEDIQKSSGIKVGSYVKSIVEGGAILSGNIPLIISAIITYPKIAVQLLRGFGITGKAALPIVKALQDLSGGAKNYTAIGLTKNQNAKK